MKTKKKKNLAPWQPSPRQPSTEIKLNNNCKMFSMQMSI